METLFEHWNFRCRKRCYNTAGECFGGYPGHRVLPVFNNSVVIVFPRCRTLEFSVSKAVLRYLWGVFGPVLRKCFAGVQYSVVMVFPRCLVSVLEMVLHRWEVVWDGGVIK